MGPLLLVGCGKMGTALLQGWLAREDGPEHVVVVEPVEENRKNFDGQARVTGIGDASAIPANFKPEIIVFAVKPQSMDETLPVYQAQIAMGAACLSIAAGKTIAYFQARFGDKAPIIRAISNTPAAVGRGISVLCASATVSDTLKQTATDLMMAVGEVVWVADEALIDPVTAVSGSGPAYVFLLIECLAEAGIAAGLPADLAMRLAHSTVTGAGELARQSAESASQLRKNVTSPKGTTEQALQVLIGPQGLQPLLTKAVAAATKRSQELAG